MKKNVLLLLFMLSLSSFGQEQTISRDWTSFVQTVDINSDTEKKFKLVGNLKVAPNDEKAWAGLWARIDTKDGEPGFFDNMGDRGVRDNEWKEYTVEGTINKNSKTLNFGGLCLYNGQFYFDNLRLYIEDNEGKFQIVPILNGGFETKVSNNKIQYWNESIKKESSVRIKEYTITSSKEKFSGKKSLLITGKGIDIPEQDRGQIGKKGAKNPEIENMISMLEDLKNRVDRHVKNLSQEHTDHLHDEKSNRIGALIMHLAAAEAYYQKFTFGKKITKKENKELWVAGMDLDNKGRELLKGKPISFYLNIYNEVRAKTIEELRKQNDEWFKSTNAGNSISNQYAWFHVMEHQSSHLGQILFLKKRLPKNLTFEKKIKN